MRQATYKAKPSFRSNQTETAILLRESGYFQGGVGITVLLHIHHV